MDHGNGLWGSRFYQLWLFAEALKQLSNRKLSQNTNISSNPGKTETCPSPIFAEHWRRKTKRNDRHFPKPSRHPCLLQKDHHQKTPKNSKKFVCDLPKWLPAHCSHTYHHEVFSVTSNEKQREVFPPHWTHFSIPTHPTTQQRLPHLLPPPYSDSLGKKDAVCGHQFNN